MRKDRNPPHPAPLSSVRLGRRLGGLLGLAAQRAAVAVSALALLPGHPGELLHLELPLELTVDQADPFDARHT